MQLEFLGRITTPESLRANYFDREARYPQEGGPILTFGRDSLIVGIRIAA